MDAPCFLFEKQGAPDSDEAHESAKLVSGQHMGDKGEKKMERISIKRGVRCFK